ncbi:MAG: YbgA family protein [Desulfobaccales bacterium]
MEKIRIGISACLLGESVRFDGGHQLDRFITGTLGQYLEFFPVCPEVECGLGVPREAMRLVGDPEAPRLMTVRTKVDLTRRMLTWAQKRVGELEQENLCGFIFKSKSPSSGMERVKVYPERGPGPPVARGVGMFARIFMEHFPLLPVEEEGRLHDPVLRENFIARLFVLLRWREFLAPGPNLRGLVAFHTRHKLLILAHSPNLYRELGRLAARAKELPLPELCRRYQSRLMEALRLKATPKKNTIVLSHLMGYFKKDLSPDEKQELREVIDSYHQGYVPLVVPTTLINHYVRKYHQPCLQEQFYLHPHPVELQLRNHV